MSKKIGKQPVTIDQVADLHQQMEVLTRRCGELVQKMDEQQRESVVVEGKEGSETFLKRVSGFLSNIQRELDMPISLLRRPAPATEKQKPSASKGKGRESK